MNETTTKRKTWKIDAGNSTDGPCGFVVYGIKAATAEEALAKIKAALPNSIETREWATMDERIDIIAYLNADNLTLDNIEEDEDEEDDANDATPDPGIAAAARAFARSSKVED